MSNITVTMGDGLAGMVKEIMKVSYQSLSICLESLSQLRGMQSRWGFRPQWL